MKLNICLLIISVSLFSSCIRKATRYVYASQAANINYFTQKGDSKITGYYSGEVFTRDNGFNIQTGYALSNHIALMAAYTYKQENESDRYTLPGSIAPVPSNSYSNVFDSSVFHCKRSTLELGVGFFGPLDQQKTVTYNLYSGISVGRFSIADDGLDSNNNNYSRFYNSRITKYFVQGSLNIMPIDLLHLSMGNKISLIKYHSVNTSYSDGEVSFFYLDKFKNNTFLYWEPFIDMQIALPKWHWIKIDGQISLAISNTGYSVDRVINGSVGLTIELNKLLKKKKN